MVLLLDSAEMQFESASKLLLMFPPSRRVLPPVSALAVPSDPARSTRLSSAFFTPSSSSEAGEDSIRSRMMVCEREERSLHLVAAVCRCFSAVRRLSRMCSGPRSASRAQMQGTRGEKCLRHCVGLQQDL